MLYSFARVSAVLGMRRGDYFHQGRRGWLRLHEKGGKRHDTLEHAQQIAAHASPKTTKLYDRTSDRVTVDEIERVVI